MAVLIEASDLEKRFGEIRAVDGISLEVKRGEVLGFLGPNGAGKSTTMKMLTGFLEPDAGSARIAGVDVLDEPKQAKRQLGYLPEGAPCYGDMTARGFLTFIAEIRGFDRDEAKRRVAAAVEKTQLSSVLEQKIETLSKGFKRRVAIAQAILHDPQVLIGAQLWRFVCRRVRQQGAPPRGHLPRCAPNAAADWHCQEARATHPV